MEKPILKAIAKLEGEEAAQREKAAVEMVRDGHVREGFKESYALDRQLRRRILSKLGIGQGEDGQSR